MEIKTLNTNHSGNWIVARETKPELHQELDGGAYWLGIENAEWHTNHGRAEINTIVAVNTESLVSVLVGYRYTGRKYNGGSQYWQHYIYDGRDWQRMSWKKLDDGQRMLILDAWQSDDVPGWANCPGKLVRDYLRPGELRRLEVDEQGTIYGYKYLILREDGQYCSPNYPEIVWVGGELEADQEPSRENTHGIYAMKSRKSEVLYRYQGPNRHQVRIALSGTVIEGNEGVRGQHAQIVEVLS